MEIRWKLHCQVVATHILTYPLEVKEKKELKNLSKWGKFSFLCNGRLFTHDRNVHIPEKKKQLIIIVNMF